MLVGGPGTVTIGCLGAAEVDRTGNINSTRLADGRFLVGSGRRQRRGQPGRRLRGGDVGQAGAAAGRGGLRHGSRGPGDQPWSPIVASSANSTEGFVWPRCPPGSDRSTSGSGPWSPPAVGSPRWRSTSSELQPGDHGGGARAARVRSPTAIPRLTRPDYQGTRSSSIPLVPVPLPVRWHQLRLTSRRSVS